MNAGRKAGVYDMFIGRFAVGYFACSTRNCSANSDSLALISCSSFPDAFSFRFLCGDHVF